MHLQMWPNFSNCRLPQERNWGTLSRDSVSGGQGSVVQEGQVQFSAEQCIIGIGVLGSTTCYLLHSLCCSCSCRVLNIELNCLLHCTAPYNELTSTLSLNCTVYWTEQYTVLWQEKGSTVKYDNIPDICSEIWPEHEGNPEGGVWGIS